MNKASINRLAKTGVIESINNVTATIPGEVVERKINKGQVVQPSDALYTIANLDILWAIAQVPETNAPLIKKGQKSEIQVSALNNKKIEADISYVSSIVNPETRTVVVRAEIDNTNRQLKPGMLATMLVESEPVDILTVPSEAVVRDDNTDHVFVKINNETYKMVHVKVGPEGKGQRPIYSGIEPGQVIVVKGAYHLNTERKRQLSGG
jgi:cobalt-zinc-cadmium efflux system membrane fusion protein